VTTTRQRSSAHSSTRSPLVLPYYQTGLPWLLTSEDLSEYVVNQCDSHSVAISESRKPARARWSQEDAEKR
jgi:hypothetical protein